NAPVALPWYPAPADRPIRRLLGPELWRPTPALAALTWPELLALTSDQFDRLKRGTALRRVRFATFHAAAHAAHAFHAGTTLPQP
ncbi:MAG: hypothetical protein ACREJ2_19170, partial [Planctomycetota bacterium]